MGGGGTCNGPAFLREWKKGGVAWGPLGDVAIPKSLIMQRYRSKYRLSRSVCPSSLACSIMHSFVTYPRL